MATLLDELSGLISAFNENGVEYREGLVKMKRRAGRPQDSADIERLENEAG